MERLAAKAAQDLADAPAEDIVRWAVEKFGDRVTISVGGWRYVPRPGQTWRCCVFSPTHHARSFGKLCSFFSIGQYSCGVQ